MEAAAAETVEMVAEVAAQRSVAEGSSKQARQQGLLDREGATIKYQW